MNKEHIKRAVEIMGSQARLAKSIGVSQAAIHLWVTGQRRAKPHVALQIERATNGQVTRADLCPELFSGCLPVDSQTDIQQT